MCLFSLDILKNIYSDIQHSYATEILSAHNNGNDMTISQGNWNEVYLWFSVVDTHICIENGTLCKHNRTHKIFFSVVQSVCLVVVCIVD